MRLGWHRIALGVFIGILSSCNKNGGVIPKTYQAAHWIPEIQSIDTNLNSTSEYVVVIGDIQQYTQTQALNKYYQKTLSWIISQNRYYQINCILQTGDITNDNLSHQWDLFLECTQPLIQQCSYLCCIGNHDYQWNLQAEIWDRNNTQFNKYISTLYDNDNINILTQFEAGHYENIVAIINTKEGPIHIIILEYGPRTEVVHWINQYISQNTNTRFFILLHEYLNKDGERLNHSSIAKLQLKNTTVTTPEELWHTLISKHNNIIGVLCGHAAFFSKMLITENNYGRNIPQIGFNIQDSINGGNGWVQLWEFPTEGDSCYIKPYNTIHRTWDHNKDNYFSFQYKD